MSFIFPILLINLIMIILTAMIGFAKLVHQGRRNLQLLYM